MLPHKIKIEFSGNILLYISVNNYIFDPSQYTFFVHLNTSIWLIYISEVLGYYNFIFWPIWLHTIFNWMRKLPKLFWKLRYDYVFINTFVLIEDARVVNLNVIKKIEGQNYERNMNRYFTEGTISWQKEHEKSLTSLAIREWNPQWDITTHLSRWLKF